MAPLAVFFRQSLFSALGSDPYAPLLRLLAVGTSHPSLVALPERLPLLADGLTLLDGAKGQPRHRHWVRHESWATSSGLDAWEPLP